MTILEVNNLKKVYATRLGGQKVAALANVSFSVEAGEFVAIMGESGAGKTTLLNILAMLDKQMCIRDRYSAASTPEARYITT